MNAFVVFQRATLQRDTSRREIKNAGDVHRMNLSKIVAPDVAHVETFDFGHDLLVPSQLDVIAPSALFFFVMRLSYAARSNPHVLGSLPLPQADGLRKKTAFKIWAFFEDGRAFVRGGGFEIVVRTERAIRRRKRALGLSNYVGAQRLQAQNNFVYVMIPMNLQRPGIPKQKLVLALEDVVSHCGMCGTICALMFQRSSRAV